MQVTNITISNYRSVDSNTLTIPNLQKYNLFIGKNNSGKSNILKIIPLLNDFFSLLTVGRGKFSVSQRNSIDSQNLSHLFFDNTDASVIDLLFTINLNTQEAEKLAGIGVGPGFKEEYKSKASKVILEISLHREGDGIEYVIEKLILTDVELINRSTGLLRRSDSTLASPQEYPGSIDRINELAAFQYIFNILRTMKEICANKFVIIKAFRKASAYENLVNQYPNINSVFETLDLDGVNTIDILSNFISPPDNPHVYRRKYEGLNKFVSELIGEKVTLTHNKQKSDLFVNQDGGNSLSLKSWGSSMEEIICIAIILLNYGDNSVIAFEEPEIHLDAGMQRKFIRFLKDTTTHQYLISSHSQVFINDFSGDENQIYRVFLEDKHTKIELADRGVLHKVIYDLGVKASDLLQTNGIIWVEGPSDRVYLLKWLEIYIKNNSSPQFLEGKDFSILYYGGSILSNFSLSEEIISDPNSTQVNDFINLLSVNKHAVVVMDRDSENGGKWATKQRIVSEMQGYEKGLSWITEGKEIESYLTQRNIDESYPQKLKQPYSVNKKDFPFGDNFRTDAQNNMQPKPNVFYENDKLEFAKKIVEKMTLEDLLSNKELLEKVTSLHAAIQTWND